ncbi:hypothetical protein GGF31_003701 [Allomyces arbusculus]|nr:hypothetical protein GGF31_003701 [Allomyces arbusculus]
MPQGHLEPSNGTLSTTASTDATGFKYRLVDLIRQCNNVPASISSWIAEKNAAILAAAAPGTNPPLFAFWHIDGVRVGLLTPDVAALVAEERKYFDHPKPDVFELRVPEGADDGVETRTAWIAEMVSRWRAQDRFPALRGWRNELYSVYGVGGAVALAVERAASGLLGLRTYGCHLTGYTLPKGASHPHKDLKVWIARRSLTKPTFPGLLDNMAAGGLTHGQNPVECIVRECEEEASIPIEVAQARVVPAGLVSYCMRQDHLPSLGGCIGAETQFVFDLRLDEDFSPAINDGEVHGFTLMRVDEVMAAMRRGEFKPNCAVVMIDFLVRHGYITPDTEPEYLEIVHGSHRPLEWEFPGPSSFAHTLSKGLK